MGYYFWCSYHPEILIQIGDAPTRKDSIEIEAPKIAVTGNGFAEPAASVELKVNDIIMQHEFMAEYVCNNYKASDIQLDIQVKENQMLLKYYGTVTNLNDEIENFEKIIDCDYVLDATIRHE